MKAIDLFCGAGGLTLGLRNAGWNVVAGVDEDDAVRATYEKNNSEAVFISADLRSIAGDEIREKVGDFRGDDLLLAGCAPCQPFSKQRPRTAPRRRAEGTLLRQFARLVKEFEPKVVLMENVPGIASVPGFSSLRRFLKTLNELGYESDLGVLNARHFGVPQHRRRFVLVAALGSAVRLPSPTHDRFVNPVTVRHAIEHFPPIVAGAGNASLPNHHAAGLSAMNLRRIRATPADGGSRREWPKELRLKCHTGLAGFSDVYGRMWWDRVAPTLTSRCNSYSNGRFGHPIQDRAISLREAAAIQTFPDDYEFVGTNNGIARWIGNAVPVKFAEALGRAAAAAVS